MENIEHNKEKLPGRVYCISSPEDGSVAVAMDVTVSGNTIRWFDTIKERVMTAKEIKPGAEGTLIFTRIEEEGGGTYSLTPITIELYNAEVKRKLLVPKEFNDLDELLGAFEETKKNAW